MDFEKIPHYFPMNKGVYELAAGISLYGKDGANDVKNVTFQFDENTEVYLDNKAQSRRDDIHKYYAKKNLSKADITSFVYWMSGVLKNESPQYFLVEESESELKITSKIQNIELTYKKIPLNLETYEPPSLKLVDTKGVDFHYQDEVDAICSLVCEDISLVSFDEINKDTPLFIHLSSPNYWDPNDKVGKSFHEIHSIVGDYEKTLGSIKEKLVKVMFSKNRYQRFAWGLATDNRFNHHPVQSRLYDGDHWYGRAFNPREPELYIRLERQTITPVIPGSLMAFTIKTYFYDVTTLSQIELPQLKNAVLSMSEDALNYKGLDKDRDEIVKYLESLILQ